MRVIVLIQEPGITHNKKHILIDTKK